MSDPTVPSAPTTGLPRRPPASRAHRPLPHPPGARRGRDGRRLRGRADRPGPAGGSRSRSCEAGHRLARGPGPVRGRAAGARGDGPRRHRQGARRRARPTTGRPVLRDGAGPGRADHRLLRRPHAHRPRAARPVHRRSATAVQHAHQKGVIHRDLKPSNMLVAEADGRPVPKVIDFGIAKADRAQRLTERTPCHRSSAQAVGHAGLHEPGAGGDVGPRRRHPHRCLQPRRDALRAARRADCRRIRRSWGCTAFMARLAHDRRDGPADARARELATLGGTHREIAGQRSGRPMPTACAGSSRGDLDWIVMKAMEKDRDPPLRDGQRAGDRPRSATSRDEPVTGPPAERRATGCGSSSGRHRLGVAGRGRGGARGPGLGGAAAATLGLVRATRAERARPGGSGHRRDRCRTSSSSLFQVSDPGEGAGQRRHRPRDPRLRRPEDRDRPRRPAAGAGPAHEHDRATCTASWDSTPRRSRLLTRSLATREQTLGPGVPAELAQSMTSLGQAVRRTRPLRRGGEHPRFAPRACPRTSSQSSTQSCGPSPTLYRLTGRFAESDSLVRVRVAALEQALGPEDEQVLDALATLGSSQAEQGKSAAAESLFRRIHRDPRAPGRHRSAAGAIVRSCASALFEQHQDRRSRVALPTRLRRGHRHLWPRAYGGRHPAVQSRQRRE